jgi:magnesium-transporting ATPase (P-type)
LIYAAADFGYVFIGRYSPTLTIKVNGGNRGIELLNVKKFTSERKRSLDIICHLEYGEILLLCKGSDDLFYATLDSQSPYQQETLQS